MEVAIALLVGVYMTAAVYMLLSKHTIRILLGTALLANGTNLLIFTGGRLTREIPPFVPVGFYEPQTAIANPLPQALVLTAIVISFSIFAFLLVLAYRAYQDLQTDNTDEMRVAEPDNRDLPPLGF